MVVTEFLRYPSRAAKDDTIIKETIEALKESKRARHESLGVVVGDNTAVQITAEWDDDHQIHPGWSHLADNVEQYIGQPTTVFHAALNNPVLGPDGPGTAGVMEFAANYFPVSKTTAEFRAQINGDFAKFDKIFSKGMKGASGVAYGWVTEAEEHPDISGEKAACFLIVRGWDSYGDYEAGIKTEQYKEAMPNVLKWEAPHEIVSFRV